MFLLIHLRTKFKSNFDVISSALVFIGYSINFVSNHLLYADLKYCQNDLLFIKKEFRGGRVGLKFMKATEMT